MSPSDAADKRVFDLLMVEDDAADVDLTREALAATESSHVVVRLHVVADGEEALDFLYHRSPYENAPRPHLILLDLNMPRFSGHEVLREVKGDPALRGIPVVVLTTSDATEDVEKSYVLGANSFITKARDFSAHLEIVKTIKEFWFQAATLPMD